MGLPDDFLFRLAHGFVGRFRTRNALAPVSWFGIAGSALSWYAAYQFARVPELQPYCGFLIVVGICLIIGTLGLAIYLGVCKTERLQSEDYQLRHEALTILEKGGKPRLLDSAAVAAIANPVVQEIAANSAEGA